MMLKIKAVGVMYEFSIDAGTENYDQNQMIDLHSVEKTCLVRFKL